ncbi:MAG: NBR1-Ig-like domain-containing protein [Anaerolineales bacterium]|nr:NBR1-Ig-like domain-containing protein [Anaerolineales bacterium]
MKRPRWLFGWTVLALISLACSISGTSEMLTPIPDFLATDAASTVEAYLTQSVPTETATPFPSMTPSPTVLLPSLPPPTATTPCDQARFISDVTVPDGTIFAPNASFTKTWRLQNTGSCTWSGYSVVFHSGEAMNAPASVALGTVSPGSMVDISVNLVAPGAAGSYRGYWRIRTASGTFVPIVNAADGYSFFVDIRVQTAATATSSPTSTWSFVPVLTILKFDLHAKAPEAQWISGGGSGSGTNLTFGGPDSDPNGFAMYRNGFLLEDGSRPEKVLQMHPKWVDNGVISGRYPSYTVQNGDRFVTKVGFLANPDGTCGAGNVIFQLNYREAGTLHALGQWTDTCNGSLVSVDVNLNSLAGRTVQFILAVLANGSSAQDWAVWVHPRVVNP